MEHKFLIRYLILLAILILAALTAWGIQELAEEPAQDAVLVYERNIGGNRSPVLLQNDLSFSVYEIDC